MSNFNDLNKLIKTAASEAIERSKPVNVVFGNVISVSPLQINLEEKITLSSAQLILTQNVMSYSVNMTIDEQNYTVNVDNALAVGDNVALVRMQGGQKFLVLDKVVGE